MKIIKFIVVIFVIILIAPIIFITILSFQNSDKNLLKWYIDIVENNTFIEAFILSCFVCLNTAFITTVLSFFFALSWFNIIQKRIIIIFILILGLLPPDILSLSISVIAQFFGFYESNTLLLVIGLFFYCFPFGILIFWSTFFYINPSIIVAANDMGMRRISLIIKIFIPIAKGSILNCFFLSFLLSFNEYPRTFYLSGSNLLLSEYLSGKLYSGANESIYAGASITIFITLIIILFLIIAQRSFNLLTRSKNF